MSDVRIEAAELGIEAVLDPGAQERRQENDRLRLIAAERRRAWLVSAMQHPEGRAWLKELLDRFHAFETRFASVNGYARDEMGTWLLAGEQRCGWHIWTELDNADPVLASALRRGGQPSIQS